MKRDHLDEEIIVFLDGLAQGRGINHMARLAAAEFDCPISRAKDRFFEIVPEINRRCGGSCFEFMGRRYWLTCFGRKYLEKLRGAA